MVHKVSGVERARCKQILDAIEGHVAPGHSVLVLAEGPHHDVQVGSDQDQKKYNSFMYFPYKIVVLWF